MTLSTLAKAMLFCSVCGHESPPDGDWRESETTTELGTRLTLSCPDCETTITRRRLRGERVEPRIAGD